MCVFTCIFSDICAYMIVRTCTCTVMWLYCSPQTPFQLYHQNKEKVRRFMKPLQIGVLDGPTWESERNRAMDEDFAKLWQKAKDMVSHRHQASVWRRSAVTSATVAVQALVACKHHGHRC